MAEINRFDLLEFDTGPRVTPTDHEAPIELDMVDRGGACNLCGKIAELNDMAQCRECFASMDADMQLPAPLPSLANVKITAELAKNGLVDEADAAQMARLMDDYDREHPSSDLTSIADESRRNAAAPRDNTWVAPTTVGNSDVPAIDSGASDAGIAAMREQAEVRRRQAAVAAANAELLAREERERLAIVPDETANARPYLRNGDLVAGAVAAGHGVLVGWCGKGDMTRAKLCATLASANLPAEWAPEAASARAQAGRAVGALSGQGYDVRAEKKSQRQVVELTPYDFRWTVGIVDHAGKVGDKFGEIALVCTLTADKLVIDGDAELAAQVQADYQDRIGSELYRSSDVSTWMSSVLKDKLGAVKYGVGWYVPTDGELLRRRHDATARWSRAISSQMLLNRATSPASSSLSTLSSCPIAAVICSRRVATRAAPSSRPYAATRSATSRRSPRNVAARFGPMSSRSSLVFAVSRSVLRRCMTAATSLPRPRRMPALSSSHVAIGSAGLIQSVPHAAFSKVSVSLAACAAVARSASSCPRRDARLA